MDDPGVESKNLTAIVVAGARPNFMKVAPLLRVMKARGHKAILVHTGQHYDALMSDAFFRDLGIDTPDHHLNVGSGTHAQQTAGVMTSFEPVLLDVRPDWVIVVGDVNSTLACALVAAKLAPAIGCRIAHVEAGLRSGDWSMPEEVNRVITDRCSDLLLIPSLEAADNLRGEGLPDSRIRFVGNVMIDSLLAALEVARASPHALGLRTPYALVTLHRPSNVDDPRMLSLILADLDALSRHMRVVFPIHPRTSANIERFGLSHLLHGIETCGPVGYLEMLHLTDRAAVVVTDSGGVQEETTVLGVPCVTVRESTERPITVTEGTNRLVAWPPVPGSIVELAVTQSKRPRSDHRPEGWDGRAAHRIVDALELRA